MHRSNSAAGFRQCICLKSSHLPLVCLSSLHTGSAATAVAVPSANLSAVPSSEGAVPAQGQPAAAVNASQSTAAPTSATPASASQLTADAPVLNNETAAAAPTPINSTAVNNTEGTDGEQHTEDLDTPAAAAGNLDAEQEHQAAATSSNWTTYATSNTTAGRHIASRPACSLQSRQTLQYHLLGRIMA